MRSDCPRPSPRSEVCLSEVCLSEVRLQKYLASCGVGSRRHCEKLMSAGRVAVAGRVVTELGFRVPSEGAAVTVDGTPVQPQGSVYFMLHKPPGFLCTSRDPQGRPTFHDLLPRISGRVYSVGRLDGASEGLLLVTNDGELAHRLTHPSHRARKTYQVWTTRALTPGDIEACLAGIEVEGTRMRMKSVHRLSSQRGGASYEIVLSEGRNRQIRRMLGARGIGVKRLVRTAFGPLRLGSLPSGKSRPLTPREEAALRAHEG